MEGGKENTIKAIKFSLKYSEIIEVDVRMTKDNILVLTHSPLINQKKIKDSEWDEVRDKIEKLEDTIPLVLDKGKRYKFLNVLLIQPRPNSWSQLEEP